MEVAGHGFVPNTINEMNEKAALPLLSTLKQSKASVAIDKYMMMKIWKWH